jgi:hypothetical protein
MVLVARPDVPALSVFKDGVARLRFARELRKRRQQRLRRLPIVLGSGATAPGVAAPIVEIQHSRGALLDLVRGVSLVDVAETTPNSEEVG